MLHCLRPAVQFSEDFCSRPTLDHAGEMSVALISDIFISDIFTYDWLYSQYQGGVKMVDMASKFIENFQDLRLF